MQVLANVDCVGMIRFMGFDSGGPVITSPNHFSTRHLCAGR
ncbi:hypothetical protein A4U88_4715 [Serratia marcescens]|nr:hypothetical protein A4U88_4715 [Serratia marcescens]